jgi:hypothetical protein
MTRPPGNGKGRRPRAPTDKRVTSSPNRANDKNDLHPSPSIRERLWDALDVTADLAIAVATSAQQYDCAACASSYVHVLDGLECLLDAWHAFTGEEGVPG